jgi:small-conductance mechanosensitive channel
MNYIDGLKIIGMIALVVVCIAFLFIWCAAFCCIAYVLLGMIGITGIWQTVCSIVLGLFVASLPNAFVKRN